MSTKSFQFTAVIEREDDWFVATCPEVDVVSQGKTIEDARSNLLEAVELFFAGVIRCYFNSFLKQHRLLKLNGD